VFFHAMILQLLITSAIVYMRFVAGHTLRHGTNFHSDYDADYELLCVSDGLHGACSDRSCQAKDADRNVLVLSYGHTANSQ
jgi:hypothetical protein